MENNSARITNTAENMQKSMDLYQWFQSKQNVWLWTAKALNIKQISKLSSFSKMYLFIKKLSTPSLQNLPNLTIC